MAMMMGNVALYRLLSLSILWALKGGIWQGHFFRDPTLPRRCSTCPSERNLFHHRHPSDIHNRLLIIHPFIHCQSKTLSEDLLYVRIHRTKISFLGAGPMA